MTCTLATLKAAMRCILLFVIATMISRDKLPLFNKFPWLTDFMTIPFDTVTMEDCWIKVRDC